MDQRFTRFPHVIVDGQAVPLLRVSMDQITVRLKVYPLELLSLYGEMVEQASLRQRWLKNGTINYEVLCLIVTVYLVAMTNINKREIQFDAGFGFRRGFSFVIIADKASREEEHDRNDRGYDLTRFTNCGFERLWA